MYNLILVYGKFSNYFFLFLSLLKIFYKRIMSKHARNRFMNISLVKTVDDLLHGLYK